VRLAPVEEFTVTGDAGSDVVGVQVGFGERGFTVSDDFYFGWKNTARARNKLNRVDP